MRCVRGWIDLWLGAGGLCYHVAIHALQQGEPCTRLHVKRGTWNGMERGMEHGMERGTDVKCRNESNKRIN